MSDDAVRKFDAFLSSLGADPADPELASTAERVTKLLRERFVAYPPLPELPLIPLSERERGPVAIRGVPFHSLCAHHVTPFFGHFHVLFLPRDHAVGFGAIGRLVDALSRRPQIQERLTAQIADALHDALNPEGLVVVSTARQMCMELTGSVGSGETTVAAGRGIWGGERAWEIARTLVDR